MGCTKEAFYNTAGAARSVAQEQLTGVGAICNRRAAEMYGLEVLEDGVQDVKNNYTRFLVLSRWGKPDWGRICNWLICGGSMSGGERRKTGGAGGKLEI